MTGSSALSSAQALATTVTVMDQHGKVVHNGSKTFFSAFREAKEAYKQRKAEIASERQAQRRARETVMRRGSHRRHSDVGHIQDAPNGEGNSGDSSALVHHRKRHRKDVSRQNSSLSTRSICEDEFIAEDALVREDSLARQDSMQFDDVAMTTHHAMDMAPALFNDPSVMAVQALLARVQSIIDEIQCMAVGLSTLLSELQKTPETFAAVGLSLAEIASMITNVSPTAMVVLKAGFPTVFALINSPHFAVIAGVGAAATVVVLGGYKIVKSIMAGADENLRMAYGELPDEAILKEAELGGKIMGEVIEEDRLVESAHAYRGREPVEELAMPRPPPKHARQVEATTPAPSREEREGQNRWLKAINGNKEKEKKTEKVHSSKEKRRDSSSAPSSKYKEERRERKGKEEKDERRKDSRDRRPERRGATSRQNSSSSGVSSNRSESSEGRRSRSPKEASTPSSPSKKHSSKEEKSKSAKDDKSKSSSKDKDSKNGDDKKKKNAIIKLFNGRS